jgi:hypothetical protein
METPAPAPRPRRFREALRSTLGPALLIWGLASAPAWLLIYRNARPVYEARSLVRLNVDSAAGPAKPFRYADTQGRNVALNVVRVKVCGVTTPAWSPRRGPIGLA